MSHLNNSDSDSSSDSSSDDELDSYTSSESDDQTEVKKGTGQTFKSKSNQKHETVSGKLARARRPANKSKKPSKSTSSDASPISIPVVLDIATVDGLMTDAEKIDTIFPGSRSSNKPSASRVRYQEALHSFINVRQTKLVLAVCGPRGAGKSEVINNLAVSQSLAQSLWGLLPLASSGGGDRVTEAPTYLLHSQQHYIKVVWNNTIVKYSHLPPADPSIVTPPANPCIKPDVTIIASTNPSIEPDVTFMKNKQEEWYSECWKGVRKTYGKRDEIEDKRFLDCMNRASHSSVRQNQLLDLWAINQFLFSLATWFGEHVPSIMRIEIGLSHWAFHRDVTLIDMPGWETEKAVSSSAALRSVDGVILVSSRAAGSHEVQTLLEYGAFNKSKQAIDMSNEDYQAWKPPFLLSLYQQNDKESTGPARNKSVTEDKVRENFNLAVRQLSDDATVLPEIHRWDERAEHFDVIMRNSFICPLLSSPETRAQSINESVGRFVSAIRAESCWTILNKLSSFVLFAQRAFKASPAAQSQSDVEPDATSTARFNKVVVYQSGKLKDFLQKLERKQKKKLAELVKARMSESVDPFAEPEPSVKKKRGRPKSSKQPVFTLFDGDNSSTGLPGYLTTVYNSYKKVIVYDFVSEVIHMFVNQHREKLTEQARNISTNVSTPDGSDQADLTPDRIGDALIARAESSPGLANADKQVQQFERSKKATSLLVEAFVQSIAEVNNDPPKEVRSSRKSAAPSERKKEALVKLLTKKLIDEVRQWRKSLEEHQKKIIDSVREYLSEINQVRPSDVSSSDADAILQQCKSLRQKIDDSLESYSHYIESVENNLSYVNGLTGKRILTASDRIVTTSIPRADDLYKKIASVTNGTKDKEQRDVQDVPEGEQNPVAYDVKLSTNTDADVMVLLHEPSSNEPVLAIMKTKFDVASNTLVLSTSTRVDERIRSFQQQFCSAPSAQSKHDRSSKPVPHKPNMFGESDQADRRTLFPMYTICWTDEKHSFDGQHLAIHSNWDGLPYCHFLLVEPGAQCNELVNSLQQSLNNQFIGPGIKVVIELPSANMLPQYAIDIAKHVMEYFNFDFCWRVSTYARTREKHSIKIKMRECTLARAIFSMQVATCRLFEFVTTKLAAVLEQHSVIDDNVQDIVDLSVDKSMSKKDSTAYAKQEGNRIRALLKRLHAPPEKTSKPGVRPSDADLFAVEDLLCRFERLLQSDPEHDDAAELRTACEEVRAVIQPWRSFGRLAFWPTESLLQQFVSDFPAVHSVMHTSAYARILVLEHLRPLHDIWMADQQLTEGAWKSNVDARLVASSHKASKSKSKKSKKSEKQPSDSWTLAPDDVRACETAHSSQGGTGDTEGGCIVLVTSFGVEYYDKTPKVRAEPVAVPPSPSHATPRSIPPVITKTSEQSKSLFTPSSSSPGAASTSRSKRHGEELSQPEFDDSSVLSNITQPTPDQWTRLFRAINRTNAIDVHGRNPGIGYSTLCARKKLWDEDKKDDAVKPLARRRGKNASKSFASRDEIEIEDGDNMSQSSSVLSAQSSANKERYPENSDHIAGVCLSQQKDSAPNTYQITNDTNAGQVNNNDPARVESGRRSARVTTVDSTKATIGLQNQRLLGSNLHEITSCSLSPTAPSSQLTPKKRRRSHNHTTTQE